jgi:5-methyltetrahydrofolate--homocysteine methyltransferase
MEAKMELLKELADSVISGKAPQAKELTSKALAAGAAPKTVLDGLIAGMNVVGEKFKNNEFYVPEVLIAARAMKSAMEILKPRLVEAGVEPIGKIVVGTVKGDLHDIGKNLVAMMLEGAGFEVVDLGVDVSPEKFLNSAKESGAKAIGMSALLTTTMLNMKQTVQAVDAANLKGKIKVIIGGAPVTQNYADEIGADGYAADAASAVSELKRLLNLA